MQYLVILKSVTIVNGIYSIGESPFSKQSSGSYTYNGITYRFNPNLATITINKSCSDIKNNLLYNSSNYYPWLQSISPYKATGVTIYGANNKVCALV